jgi:hypothetical protein
MDNLLKAHSWPPKISPIPFADRSTLGAGDAILDRH